MWSAEIGNANIKQDRTRFLMATLQPRRRPHVCDIGANPIDRPPYADALEAGHCHVIGFEPQKHAFDALEATKTEYETYFQVAVGDGRDIDFREYKQSGLSSAYAIDEANLAFMGRSRRAATVLSQTTIPTTRLDDLTDVPLIDVLKIDVQGSEVAIIENGAAKLAQAVCVIAEARFGRLYQDEPLADALFATLQAQGFSFHKFLFMKSTMVANSQSDRLRGRRLRSQAIDGDVVFVRSPAGPGQLSDEQLKHLAFAADTMFDSPDLCVHCLDVLVARDLLSADVPGGYVDLLPAALKRDVAS